MFLTNVVYRKLKSAEVFKWSYFIFKRLGLYVKKGIGRGEELFFLLVTFLKKKLTCNYVKFLVANNRNKKKPRMNRAFIYRIQSRLTKLLTKPCTW